MWEKVDDITRVKNNFGKKIKTGNKKKSKVHKQKKSNNNFQCK